MIAATSGRNRTEKEDPVPVPDVEARTSTGLPRTEGTLDLEEAAEAILKYEGVFELTSTQKLQREKNSFRTRSRNSGQE